MSFFRSNFSTSGLNNPSNNSIHFTTLLGYSRDITKECLFRFPELHVIAWSGLPEPSDSPEFRFPVSQAIPQRYFKRMHNLVCPSLSMKQSQTLIYRRQSTFGFTVVGDQQGLN
jgi:hypothetical protein